MTATNFLSALIVAAITSVLHIVVYYAFYRREAVRDEAIHRLQDQLDDLEREKLSEIGEKLQYAGLQRKTIYERLEKDVMSRRECRMQQAHMEETFRRLERTWAGMTAQIGEIIKETAENAKAVSMICSQMHIRIGEDPHG